MEVKPGYKQTEVGAIPEEWLECDISDLCQLQRGFDLTEATRKRGDIPVYSSSGLSYFHNEARLQPPAVITGRKGMLGRVFFVEEPCWPHDTTLWVKDFKGNYPRFVALFLGQFRLERFDAATSVPTLNRNNVVGIPIKLPSLPEQRAIAEALSDVDGLLGGLDRLIAKKRDLKQAAMQQLLTGQTRLPGFLGEWEVKTLGSIGKLKNGLNKDSSSFGHGLPFVNLMDVFGVNAISSNGHLGLVASTKMDREVYDLREGDVLFIRSSVKPSGVGLTAVVERDLPDTVYSGFLIRFRDEGTLDSGFKKHCFYSDSFRKKVIAASSVSANTNINQNALAGLTLLLPPTKAEQTAIAAVLSEMDGELAVLEQRREKTHALKRAMMQELLTGRTRII